MRKKIFLLTFLSMVIMVGMSGCYSTNVKYPKELQNETIDTVLYVTYGDDYKNIKVNIATQDIQKTIFYSGNAAQQIFQLYSRLNTRNIFIKEIVKQQVNIEKRVRFKSLLPESVSIPSINLTTDDVKNRKAPYDFSQIKNKIGSRYLYQIKIYKIGFSVDDFDEYMSITSEATIYDMESSTVVWQKYMYEYSSYQYSSINLESSLALAKKIIEKTVKKLNSTIYEKQVNSSENDMF